MTTVALGLGLVAVVFTVLNVVVFRVDAVRNPRELFGRRAAALVRRGARAIHAAAIRSAAPRTSVFSDAFAMLPDIDSRIDGRMMAGTLVTGNFFQVLGVDAALGRTLTPPDDEPFAGRPVMVLSHRGWSRLFTNDLNVIGRRLLVNGFPYELVGVMPEAVMVEINNEQVRSAMVQAVMAEPSVAAVAASWPDTLGRPRGAFAETRTGRSTVAYKLSRRSISACSTSTS